MIDVIDFIPYPLLAGLGCLILLLFLLRRRGHRPAYLFVFTLFWLYLLLVASLIVFPIPHPSNFGSRESASQILSYVNWTPFAFGWLFHLSPWVIFDNLAGNILLTMPFGFGINFLARLPVRRILWLALAAGASLEASQLAVSVLIGGAYRAVDINDALLNAVGVLIGYGLFQVFAYGYHIAIRQRGNQHP